MSHIVRVGELTVEQFLVWLYDYARENHNNDIGLALLELELQGCLD